MAELLGELDTQQIEPCLFCFEGSLLEVPKAQVWLVLLLLQARRRQLARQQRWLCRADRNRVLSSGD